MTLCYGMTLYCWQHPHMIAAGLHDGNVVVFNLQRDYSREAACHPALIPAHHKPDSIS